jgi:D-arabinose 1-dehydrogenase-like Zn-dependent alcohol dehydrogenase
MRQFKALLVCIFLGRGSPGTMSDTTERVAFLGLGLLGSGFAEAAAKRGDTVVVWNRTLSKAEPLKAFGVTVASTVQDAVRGARRVHLVCPSLVAAFNGSLMQCLVFGVDVWVFGVWQMGSVSRFWLPMNQ